MIYANEWDKNAAHWLSCLPLRFDEIDTRSIEFVQGSEIANYEQCHFFAGIGGWPLALEIAGWPNDARVWTGSCPCQPFSQAGKRKGTADERHLWPEFRRLINECRPPTIFGEQVASKAGRDWLAVVRTDLEALGYAVGAADLSAASVGAPHIRQRLFWVAHCEGYRWRQGVSDSGRGNQGTEPQRQSNCSARFGGVERLAYCDSGRLQEHMQCNCVESESGQQASSRRNTCGCRKDGRMANTRRDGGYSRSGSNNGVDSQERSEQVVNDKQSSGMGNADSSFSEQGNISIQEYLYTAPASVWSDVEFVPCRDGKARPVKPGVRLLAHGVSGRVAVERTRQSGDAEIQETHFYSRVAALKGLGNAIVPQVAAEFIAAFMEVLQTNRE